MPRYTDSPAITQTIRRAVPAVTIAADKETAICLAPFDGFLSQALYVPDAAYTGANTDFRRWRVQNRYQVGLGLTVIAGLDGVNAVNLVALAGTVIPLITATPAAPAYSLQPAPTPTAAPVLTNGAGALAAGFYTVAYSYVAGGVEGPLSPYASINQDGGHGIAVAAVNTPPGVSQVKWYLLAVPAAGTVGLTATKTNGAAFVITAQGNGTQPAGYAAGDVSQNDVITFNSLHVGNGIADPGGLIELTFTRG